MTSDPSSRLALYRRLLRLRRAYPALHRGAVEVLPSKRQVISYRRSHPGDGSFVVAANLSDTPASHDLDGDVALSTDHTREGTNFDGHLAPWEAVVVSAGL